MTTHSQLPTTEPKKQRQNKLSKQLEQEQNHKNGESHGGLSVGIGDRESEGKETETQKKDLEQKEEINI